MRLFAFAPIIFILIAGCKGSSSLSGPSTGGGGSVDVLITASWDSAADLDLHVIEPSGTEIFWNNPTSSTGGSLDLDANDGCSLNKGINKENVHWSNAPAGSYTVRLDYYLDCSTSSTNYTVTVKNGSTSSTFTGNFSGAGDVGNTQGRTITTFNRVN